VIVTHDMIALRQRQRDRLAEVVAHAREHSPYYRELCRGLPDRAATF
jgi:phenylacetate-coenzyme A ligase PaaK-like adenylate-forming protein